MTDDRDLELQLRTWLDEEGPQDVPDRVVDLAIEEAATARRLRPLPGPVTALLSRVEAVATARQVPVARAWLAIALLLALAVAGSLVAGAFLFQVDRMRGNGMIAYDVGGDIFAVGGQPGDEPVQLTSTLDIKEGNPVWSPDGRYLAYWTTDVDHSEMHVLDRAAGRTHVLRERDALLLPLDAAIFGWSPDSTRIAVPARGTSMDGTEVGIETVVLFEIETGALEQVPLDEPAWSFGWSPDGRLLGLVSAADLFVYDIEHGELRAIRGQRDAGRIDMPFRLRDIPPVFSQDSDAVLFTGLSADGGSDGDIWKFMIDEPSGEPVRVNRANELSPVVSGDGERLAFGRSAAVTIDGALDGAPELTSELFVVAADGGPETSIATDVWPRAAWSPDSRRLVTRSLTGDELVIIDLEQPDSALRIPGHAEIGGYSWGPRPP